MKTRLCLIYFVHDCIPQVSCFFQSIETIETGVFYNNSEKTCWNEILQGSSVQFPKQYIW